MKIDYILSMERIEKCRILKELGYKYDPQTGKVFGVKGKEITNKGKDGHISINLRNHIKGMLYGHHYAWYWVYGNVDFDELDHIDIDPTNNRINNLRISNRSQQTQNRKSKGYSWKEKNQKWQSQIMVNYKKIYLGLFNTKEEAREAYLNAKKIYHDGI